MSSPKTWRVAYIGNDPKAEKQILTQFESAYEANNKPDGMVMYSHSDSYGKLAAVSITPESIAYCPFSADWTEQDKAPFDFGNAGWVAGDPRLKWQTH